MRISRFPTIYNTRTGALALICLWGAFSNSCISPELDDNQVNESAPISYPFPKSEKSIGKDPEGDRFIIRSVKGESEYVVEIPHAADDYEVSVPIQPKGQASDKSSEPKNPQITDRELVGNMPQASADSERQRSLLDEAYGVQDSGEAEPGPSYSLGLAKIVEYYRNRQYEYALIKINELLSFYPNAARLYKMKGTILNRTGELELAERAWTKVMQIDPNDKATEKALDRLRRRLSARQTPPPGPLPASGSDVSPTARD